MEKEQLGDQNDDPGQTGPAERQGLQGPNTPPDILAEYPYLRQPEKLIKEAGWDNLAELLLDRAGFLEKPEDPSIPSNDTEARDDAVLLSLGIPANQWEKLSLKNLEAGGLSHLIPQFKQEMADYRQKVKATVDSWRKR